jgi:hypothetical protein
MEEQNNNSTKDNQNSQNGQYTFFNMKDDHGFNDNITSKVEDPKKRASGRIVFIIAMIIVGVSAAMIIRGVAIRQVEKSNYQNTYNSIVETRNKIHNRIQDLRN